MTPLHDHHAGKFIRLMRDRRRWWIVRDFLRYTWPIWGAGLLFWAWGHYVRGLF